MTPRRASPRAQKASPSPPVAANLAGPLGEAQPPQPQPRVLKLPGFLVDDEIGLGDVIKKATAWAGVKPCGGCYRRAAALNQRIVVAPRRKQ